MDTYSPQISKLIKNFRKLPSVGAKTAEKMAFSILIFRFLSLLLHGQYAMGLFLLVLRYLKETEVLELKPLKSLFREGFAKLMPFVTQEIF